MTNHNPIQLPLPIQGATITIPLTQGYATVIDAIDGDLALLNWYAHVYPAGVYADRKYRTGKIWVQRQLHRVVMERILNHEIPPSLVTDHIDGDRLNNRRSNLRVATRSQNSQNCRMHVINTAGQKGVSRTRNGTYQARIVYQGRIRHLGTYATPEEAHEAYCKAAVELFGEFARFK